MALLNSPRIFDAQLLAGQVALVTGGGSGIGLELARGIGLAGARVILGSRNEERLGEATAVLRAQGIDASYKTLDIRDEQRIATVVNEILAEEGGIDILVNNAGGQFPKKAEEMSVNGWRSVIDLCLNGTFIMCRAIGPHMIERGRGKILNVSASCIDRGSPGIAHSGAARAGVSHLTRTLASEWAQFGIQVNALGPQYLSEGAARNLGPEVAAFIPSVTPAGRWAHPEELQSWAVILTSKLSDYVTGVTLYLDGGNWLGEGIVYRGSPVCPE